MCGSRGEHINTTVRKRSLEAKEPGDDYCSTRLGKRKSNTAGAVLVQTSSKHIVSNDSPCSFNPSDRPFCKAFFHTLDVPNSS